MRFLVHASGDRMFGLSLPNRVHASAHAPLPSLTREALHNALTFPLRTLDACATPFPVATTNRAAVAVAWQVHGCSSRVQDCLGVTVMGKRAGVLTKYV
eukprot:3803255-Pleurochrysis_carterae.AAC.1